MASVAQITPPEEVTEEVGTGEISEEPKAEEQNSGQGNEKLIYVMIILAVVALGAALAFLVISKKKKEEKESSEKVQIEEPQKKEISKVKASDDAGEDSNTPTQAAKEEELLPIQKETEEPKKRQITFSLIKMGLGQTDVYTAVCENEILIGRSKNADICIGDDKQLSGRHCKVRKEGNKYYIKDLDSTNGTVLNGVPIEEETPLMQDDVIFIGAFEYRITWE